MNNGFRILIVRGYLILEKIFQTILKYFYLIKEP